MNAQRGEEELPQYINNRLPWDFRDSLKELRLQWISSGCSRIRLFVLTVFEIFPLSWLFVWTLCKVLAGEREIDRNTKKQQILDNIRRAIEERRKISVCGSSMAAIVESAINPQFRETFREIDIHFNSGKFSCFLNTLRGKEAVNRAQVYPSEILDELLEFLEFSTIFVTDYTLQQYLQQQQQGQYEVVSLSPKENLGNDILMTIRGQNPHLILVTFTNPCDEINWIVSNQSDLEECPVVFFGTGGRIDRGIQRFVPKFPQICVFLKVVISCLSVLLFGNPTLFYKALS